MSEETEFTVGDLKRQLDRLDPNEVLEFDGGLTFNRIKRRGDNLQVLEFCEPKAYLDEDFRKGNPHLQVAFISADAEVDEDGSINVWVG